MQSSTPQTDGHSRRLFLKMSAGALGSLALGPASLGNIVANAGAPAPRPNFVFFLGEGVRGDEF